LLQVTQVINIVLDVAEQRGYLLTSEKEDAEPSATMPGSQMSRRDYVVRELVDTERKYVQDLENLHELKKTIEQKGVIPGDVVHDIFLNINAILDFQRRFLIKIETTNSQPDDRQEWGLPFTNYEEAFGIYQPFIANQRKAAAIAKREFDKISMADHPVVVDFNTLDGFLLKPMQRLVKYPLLLKVRTSHGPKSIIFKLISPCRTCEITQVQMRRRRPISLRELTPRIEYLCKPTPPLTEN
jgi:cell division control protein 24